MNKLGFISFLVIFICHINLFAQPASPDYFKGVAELNKKNYNASVNSFNRSIQSDNIPDAYLYRGMAYYYLENYTKALEDFKNPKIDRLSEKELWMAKIYARLGDAETSVLYLKKYLNEKNRVDNKSIISDPAFDNIQSSGVWYQFWQQDELSGDEQFLDDVSFYFSRNDYNKALNILDEALIEFPERTEFYYLRGQAYSFLKENSQAIYNFNKAIESNFTNPEYFKSRAEAFFAKEDYVSAGKDYNQAIRLKPEVFEWYLDRAVVNMKLKNFSASQKDVQFYLGYFPDDITANKLAADINKARGAFSESLRYYNALLAKDQSNPEYFKSRGAIYLETKTYRQAVNDFSMALDLDPGDGETYFYKGLARLYLNETEGACSDWQKAQRLGNLEVIEYQLKYCR